MSLNGFSKHGLLVAAVTVLATLLVILWESREVRYIMADYHDYDISIIFILKHVGTFALALLAALASGLMIWGILKRRHSLILPWMVIYHVVAILFTFTIWYDIFSRSHQQIDDILFGIIIMGVEIIVLSPIYLLYHYIRVGNMEFIDGDDSNYRKNIQDNFSEYFEKITL